MRSDQNIIDTSQTQPFQLDPARVRAARTLLRVTQQTIAREWINRSQGYYSTFERGLGHLTASEARVIADKLGLAPSRAKGGKA